LTIVGSEEALKPLIALLPGVQQQQRWFAYIINVIGSATEVPAAVYSLANSLACESISVLHISTFESEVFLIQEKDIEKADRVFQKTQDIKDNSEIAKMKDCVGFVTR